MAAPFFCFFSQQQPATDTHTRTSPQQTTDKLTDLPTHTPPHPTFEINRNRKKRMKIGAFLLLVLLGAAATATTAVAAGLPSSPHTAGRLMMIEPRSGSSSGRSWVRCVCVCSASMSIERGCVDLKRRWWCQSDDRLPGGCTKQDTPPFPLPSHLYPPIHFANPPHTIYTKRTHAYIHTTHTAPAAAARTWRWPTTLPAATAAAPGPWLRSWVRVCVCV